MLVAGVHSTARAVRVVVRDAVTGQVRRQGHVAHTGDRSPADVLASLGRAVAQGLFADVSALSVTAQGHGVLALDATGVPVAAPLDEDDIAASGAAAELVEGLGGRAAWARAVGQVPVASTPVAHLRRLAAHEPAAAARVAAVLRTGDWITWHVLGRPAEAVTDRSGAAATGLWSPADEVWRPDLVTAALGRAAGLPRVAEASRAAGRTPGGVLVAPGLSVPAALAFGLGVVPGDVVVALGGSGATFAVHAAPVADPTGTVASFADATGRHLPLVRTRNVTRVLRATAELLGRTPDELDALALGSTPGACGLVMLPYLDGEDVPCLPQAAGTLTGLNHGSMTAASFARAAVEGVLCGLADALDALRGAGVRVERAVLVGAGARRAAVRAAAPMILGLPVRVPDPAWTGAAAALGAARQAAWALAGGPVPPRWPAPPGAESEPGPDRAAGVAVREQFRDVRNRHHPEAARRADGAGRHRRA